MNTRISSIFLAGITASLMLSYPSNANTPSQSSNSKFLISQATNRGGEELIVNGTEPFWNVTIGRKGITYSTPESRQNFPYVAPITASGRPADVVRVYRLRGSNNVINTLVIRKGSCSDGMSDTRYPYSAVYISGNRVLEGCARAK
ncbi:hypothetical protein NOS3756_08490 [Nostoc sp. NIES-3756]|uniref:COG3650 family protein n=1 Tax=Nostoc sp. NIES-3756 TaxID=1751286 RepID=UPI000720F76A|nr:hypothetical protein [Nostoc sp. NIES-3756]BAT51918.1 hypothetical protein NOS3756_08490 [Nostoc sp. NIES-3756]